MKEKIIFLDDNYKESITMKDFISIDELKSFLKSPRNYFFETILHKKETEIYSLGVSVCDLLFNETIFDEKYIVSPKFDRRTKAGKDAYANFTEFESVGKIILSEEENILIREISTNVLINNELYNQVTDSNYAKICYVIDKKTGLKIKLKADVFLEDEYLIDFQSCKESSPTKFKTEIEYHNHNLTAAFVLDFLNMKDYIFVSCENKAPYQVCLYSLSEEYIISGREQYRMALDLLRWSCDNSFWCDYVQFELLKKIYLEDNLKDAMAILSNQKKPLIYIL
jgi:hypothetical protein